MLDLNLYRYDPYDMYRFRPRPRPPTAFGMEVRLPPQLRAYAPRAPDPRDPDPRPASTPASPNRKSELLFLSMLTEAQRYDWLRSSRIDVLGSNNKIYTLAKNSTYNVRDYISGVGYCAYPVIMKDRQIVAGVPDYDRFLAQKLLLETNAPAFLRIACRDRGGVDLYR